MAESKKELKRTIIKDKKVYFGELEFTSLIRTLIRVYQFNNSNQTPEVIVMPDVTKVEGVKVEFPQAVDRVLPKEEVNDEQ